MGFHKARPSGGTEQLQGDLSNFRFSISDRRFRLIRIRLQTYNASVSSVDSVANSDSGSTCIRRRALCKIRLLQGAHHGDTEARRREEGAHRGERRVTQRGSADVADGEDGDGNHKGHGGAQSRGGRGVPVPGVLSWKNWNGKLACRRLPSSHFQRQPRSLPGARSPSPSGFPEIELRYRLETSDLSHLCNLRMSAYGLISVYLCGLCGCILFACEKGEIAKQSHFERIRRLRR